MNEWELQYLPLAMTVSEVQGRLNFIVYIFDMLCSCLLSLGQYQRTQSFSSLPLL